jgi:hypothetical protein
VLKTFSLHPSLGAGDVVDRYAAALSIGEEICTFWGVSRTEVLRAGPALGSYVAHDRVMLAALALAGRIVHEAPVQFHQREHRGRSVHAYDWRRPRDAIVWYDPTRAGRRSFPTWRLMTEQGRALATAPVRPGARLRCAPVFRRWIGSQRRALRHDLAAGLAGDRLVHSVLQRAIDPPSAAVRRSVPEGSTMALVDEDNFETEVFGRRRVLPFPEREGTWWGPPADDDEAIAEVERMRGLGVSHLVVASPAFWWLDHYQRWAAYLQENCPRLRADRHFVVYDLGTSTPRAGR